MSTPSINFGTTLLTSGMRRIGLSIVTRGIRKQAEKTAEKKHPERAAPLVALKQHKADRKSLNKKSRKLYNTSGTYRAGHIPPPAIGVEPDHLMYMFRKGMQDTNFIFRNLSKKWGKRYFDFKRGGRERGRTKQGDIEEAREKLRLSGDV